MNLTRPVSSADKPLRILHLEDDRDYVELVKAMLEEAGLGVEVMQVDNHADFNSALGQGPFDLILGDYTLPSCTGLEALATARQKCPDTPFVLVSGTIGERAAIESLQSGATDYVLKQWPERLVPAVRRALQEARERAQRKRAEAQMRVQSAALEATANTIVITDRAGTVLWVNPAFTRLTGYAVEEIVGQNPRLLKSGKQDQAFYRNLWATILAGRVWHAEMVNRRKDGSLYTEENTITPVQSEQGEITHFIAVKQDVTARKQMESELKQARNFFQRSIEANPKSAETRLRLGRVLGLLGNHGQAAAELEHAVASIKDPQLLYYATLYLGYEFEKLSRRSEAREQYERAAGLFPAAQSPLLALSQLAHSSDDVKGALLALERVYELPRLDLWKDDPWWTYDLSHVRDSDKLIADMHKMFGELPR